jgi:hypothetical protein
MSHNETSTTKIDHKNEISAKNWIGSTWVAKSQLWKKSTLVTPEVIGQIWSKVNGQRWSKSTVMVNGQG